MRHLTRLSVLATAALLSACSTPVPVTTPQAAAAAAPVKASADPRDVRTVQADSVDPLNNPNGALAKRSVYFDFDQYLVRDDGKPVVQNHAAYMAKNKGRKVLIQGNTDETGGTEYNLALGQKRAEAVRKAMEAMGVAPNQLEAVSLGEEKPKAMGSSEEAHAQNRRADLVY
jgi:peptidoglycan-associated lipoprotein